MLFHVFISSFMENICHSMSGNLFSVLFNCVIFFALTLFSLEQTTVKNIQLLIKLIGLFSYLIIIYTYCYFSEAITTNSFKIGADAYDSLWNEMTMRQQKAIILVISRSQQEFRLTGLGLVDCSSARFLSVTVKRLPFRLTFIKINKLNYS